MARNRAVVAKNRLGRPGHVVLPEFSLLGESRSHAPHRAKVVARYVDDCGVEFKVEEGGGWHRPRWWLSATKAGYRMSNTATTMAEGVALAWIRAVKRGDVSIAGINRD